MTDEKMTCNKCDGVVGKYGNETCTCPERQLDGSWKEKPDENKSIEIEKVAMAIYEATRVEATWSKRSIVPEKWEDRDDKFRKMFVEIIDRYLKLDKLPTPAEAHDSWMKAYFDMGWKYGEVRDVDKKTHPDLLPFEDLPQDERDKDAIFLAFVWLAKQHALAIQLERETFVKEIEKCDRYIPCIDIDDETGDCAYMTIDNNDKGGFIRPSDLLNSLSPSEEESV